MIAKVNKVQFKEYSDLKKESNQFNLLQLITEATDFYSTDDFSFEAIRQHQLKYVLCKAFYDDYLISKNGKIRFFIEEITNADHVQGYYQHLIHLTQNSIVDEVTDYLKKTVQFYKRNEAEINHFRSNPEMNDRIELLQKKYLYEYSNRAISILAKSIVENPDDYCRDIDGNSLKS